MSSGLHPRSHPSTLRRDGYEGVLFLHIYQEHGRSLMTKPLDLRLVSPQTQHPSWWSLLQPTLLHGLFTIAFLDAHTNFRLRL